jgi:hypothetical protein
MSNHDPAAFETAARAVGFRGFGTYPRSGFVHIDLGPARRWGEPFSPRPVAFAAEAPPARERLAESRTIKGGGAAGVATIGAAGVEIAEDIIAETRGALEPLIPYLDTLRWVFIALALTGIAVAIYARLDDWKRARR